MSTIVNEGEEIKKDKNHLKNVFNILYELPLKFFVRPAPKKVDNINGKLRINELSNFGDSNA